jgi:hypothetical protein
VSWRARWLGAAVMSLGQSGGRRRWLHRRGTGSIGGVGKKSDFSSNVVPFDFPVDAGIEKAVPRGEHR